MKNDRGGRSEVEGSIKRVLIDFASSFVRGSSSLLVPLSLFPGYKRYNRPAMQMPRPFLSVRRPTHCRWRLDDERLVTRIDYTGYAATQMNYESIVLVLSGLARYRRRRSRSFPPSLSLGSFTTRLGSRDDF